jgi:hypothetical protein
LLALFCLTIAFVETDPGQNWLAHKITSRLSRDLKSKINIGHVSISLFNNMNLQQVLIEDQKKDTLLYAGNLQVHITDWFFFKDTAELKYIGLKDAQINFNRTDSVWNYQYLADYFAPPSSGKKKKSGIEFNLKKVVMENVAFVQKDAWAGEDVYLKVKGLNLDANEITASGKNIDISRLDLNTPFFHQYSYAARKPASIKKTGSSSKDSLEWNGANWRVRVGVLNIKNGAYRKDVTTLISTRTFFDDRHIDFSAITGSVKNFLFKADTITAAINLTTKERSGLLVQNLRSNIRFNPHTMQFADLNLKTNRSHLTNYFAMNFNSTKDLQDFIHSVKMDAVFNDSYVSTDDIAFFAPQIRSWKRVFKIDGKIKGTVDALDGKKVTVSSGNTALNGDFSIQGLPDINGAYINVEANEFRTTYNDAATFIPAIRTVETPNLRSLGAIRFRGTYTGFINDFVTYGTLQTALGSLKTDLNMKLPRNGVPVYSGSISTSSFQLGKFFMNPQLGVVDFHGNLKGKGFNWSSLDLDLNGVIHRIHYGNYTYQNITAKGRLNNKSFNGDFTIKDPNADLHLTGLITFGKGQPKFDVLADVKMANLKALQLTREDLSLSGQFNLNFTGSNLSDFLGSARISDASLLQNGKRLSFDSLVVYSTFSNGVRTLHARSNEFDASVKGQFDLASLPDAFMRFLNRYYPAYIRPPRKFIPNQAFTFDITTGEVEDYIKMIDSRLTGFNNSHITGSLNVSQNSLLLDADVPQFAFKNYSFSDVRIKADGNLDRLVVNGSVNDAHIGDSVNFPETNFTIQASNDVSDITINTTSNQVINQGSFSARVKTFSNGVSVGFNPSSFVLNGKTWNIEQGGELDFRKNSIVQGQVVLREAQQEIRLSTVPSDVGNWNDLHVALKNLNIGDFSPFITTANRIEGLLNGDIVVEDPQNRFNVTANVNTQQLRVDNDSVGVVIANIFYNKQTGALTGTARNADPEHRIEIGLDLDLADSANQHEDRISIKPFNYPVTYLENFIGGLFSDLQGFVTGQLDIVGEGSNQRYVGKARLHNAGLKVNFTQVFYTIDDTEIDLQEHRIDFGTMKLRDRYGKTATVKGGIDHTRFHNMEFDIEATVDDAPMELLNTTYNDNQTFYGRAKGTGLFLLTGPQSSMNMYVEAKPSETDSSYITLPPSRSRETGSANFMVERKYGREMNKGEYQSNETNINYVVNLTANPLVNMEVILDELTGDVIKGRGTGNLIIEAGTNQPLSIRGRYDIEEGNYLFTFQSFFQKFFVLRKGSNSFIEWTGDPYAARIRFDAIYTAKNVSFAPLINTLALNDTRLEKQRGDVNVVALLTGELFHPDFKFRLEFPETNNQINNNPVVAYGLQQIEKNPNEINKQVTYLIVFNSFAPYESGQQTTYSALNEFAYSTISGMFFGEVNRRLNQLLSKILGNNNFTFNFTGSLYNRNLIDQNAKGFKINQSNLNVSVSAPLVKERVQITFGSTFDVPIQSDIQQTIQIFPDVSVDWLINKTGSIRATFFYSQSPDLLLAGTQTNTIHNQRAGVKLSYRKEFNSIKDLFTKRKKQTQTPQPVDSADKAKQESKGTL